MFRKHRALGKAPEKRRYDLPLNNSPGTVFLTFLVGLMTFLAMLALAAMFVLGAMTARWTSGLENRATVEIPVADETGTLIKPEAVTALTARAAELLEGHPAVKTVDILDSEDISALLKPWTGGDIALGNMPVPGLIALEMKKDTPPDSYAALEDRLKAIAPRARLDTHESWLRDLLRFTGALQFAAAALTLIVGMTTAAAVAGGVRARMAIHSAEIEILHLMGAADRYISRQFQRHSLISSLKGAGAGLAAGALVLLVTGWLAGQAGVNLLPAFNLSAPQIAAFALLPLTVAGLAALSAAHTVKKVLNQMP